MSKFDEKRKAIIEEYTSSKKTFNESLFNTVFTEILNDPDYEKVEMTSDDETVTTQPIGALRKGLIGSVAKAAGADQAEQEKLIETHTFPKLPMYDYVDSGLQEFLRLGKRFSFSRKEDFQGSIEFENQKECTKEIKTPGTGATKLQKHGAYVKLKAKSNCPKNLREDI